MGNCLVPSSRAAGAQNDLRRQMELEREEGQALLREMVLTTNNNGETTATNNNNIDWAAVIAKANELHAREQEYLRKQSPRERKRFAKRQRRALQKRKQYDAVGSFSVNMLTYRRATTTSSSSIVRRDDDEEEEDYYYYEEFPHHHHASSKSAATTRSLGDDTHSNGSTVSYTALHSSRSHDETNMRPIEEDHASDADDSI
jgi:hypothetical protein